MMTRSFLRLCIVSGVIGAPNIASALPPARTATISHDVLFMVEFSLILQKGNEIERGIIHPEAMKLFAADMFLPWLGAFGYAQLGKGRGEGFAGVVLRPPLGDDTLRLDLGIGGGLGVGGIPIPGWYIRFEAKERLHMSTLGFYHYLTGWNQDLQFRFRPWYGWFVEPWLGMFASVAGKHEVFDSPEGGLSVSALLRWPLYTLLTFAWPIRQVEGRLEARFRVSAELQFPVQF